MAKAKDIRFDDASGDLFINPLSGDFEIAESDTKHVEDIIQSFVGDWKQFPLLGVGIIRYSSSTSKLQSLLRNINVQLKGDGFKLDKVSIQEGQLYITGERRNVNI